MNLQSRSLYQDLSLHQPLKASLFHKVYQLRGVVEELEKVHGLVANERTAWLHEHRSMLLELFQTFREEVRLDVEQDQIDPEMMALLTDYSRALKECAALIQALIPDIEL